ncbi:hypothetical protein AVEN_184585-1 [Araneus ventricosus]|uniref:Uncharacterized protein n=1 Tax=Araneus ventricosus TaxID=182803 RepID=A0A4Y2G5Q5_ARAVE|nr:hypothetical protein AVEN_184585-1 [Araneus ventricosus]
MNKFSTHPYRPISLKLETELHPPLPGILGEPNNGYYDSSDTEIREPIAITGHGPTAPEGGTFRHRSGVTQSTPLLCPPGSENPLPCLATSHPRTRVAPGGGNTAESTTSKPH